MAGKMQPPKSNLVLNLSKKLTQKKRGAVLLFVIALFLSACAFDPTSILRTPRMAETPEAPEDASENAEAGEKPTPGDKRPGSKIAPDLPPEITDALQKPDQVAAVEIDLTNFKERLLGLDGEEIQELFGKPKLDRNEPPARIWQFQSEICFVDLFLFAEAGDLTVDHVEVRGKKVEKISEKVCFASVLKEANGGETKPLPLGPLQPAPGAVKVEPVKQELPNDDAGEEIAPPSLIEEELDDAGEKDREEPELPSFGSEDPEKDQEPEVPAFGAEDPSQDAPKESPAESPDAAPEELPSFGTEEPEEGDGEEPPAVEKTLEKTPEKTTDEAGEPEVEFKMSPVPNTGQKAAPKPEPEAVPDVETEIEEELEAEPEAKPEPEVKPELIPEPIPEPKQALESEEEQEMVEPELQDYLDRDAFGSEEDETGPDQDLEGEQENELDDGDPVKSDEIPNAPKLGTTQTEEDLLKDPAP